MGTRWGQQTDTGALRGPSGFHHRNRNRTCPSRRGTDGSSPLNSAAGYNDCHDSTTTSCPRRSNASTVRPGAARYRRDEAERRRCARRRGYLRSATALVDGDALRLMSGTRSRRCSRCASATASTVCCRAAPSFASSSATRASSSNTRFTPARFMPSVVSSWIRLSRAMSASLYRRLPPPVRDGSTSLALVDAQGLRMHPRQFGGDRDDVHRPIETFVVHRSSPLSMFTRPGGCGVNRRLRRRTPRPPLSVRPRAPRARRRRR